MFGAAYILEDKDSRYYGFRMGLSLLSTIEQQ